MLTKAELKQIAKLKTAKGRHEQQAFVCEGRRLIESMIGSYQCRLLVGTEPDLSALLEFMNRLPYARKPQRVECVGEAFDFRAISTMTTPQSAVAVFSLQDITLPSPSAQSLKLQLLLDKVQDPGNVGTIIRTADWFGVSKIYLTRDCADPYSPKVLQSSMGALGRVHVAHIADPSAWLRTFPGQVIGTFLEGEDLYTATALTSSQRPTLLVLGNEGNGISPEVEAFVTKKVTIPSYAPHGTTGAESLNVAIAGAVCLSELSKQQRQNVEL